MNNNTRGCIGQEPLSGLLFLSLTPLRRSAGSFESELLAFFGPRVALQEAAYLEVFALFRSDFYHCTRESETDSLGLSLLSPALHVRGDRVGRTEECERRECRLHHNVEREIFVGHLAVDEHRGGLRFGDAHARGRRLASSYCLCVPCFFCHSYSVIDKFFRRGVCIVLRGSMRATARRIASPLPFRAVSDARLSFFKPPGYPEYVV